MRKSANSWVFYLSALALGVGVCLPVHGQATDGNRRTTEPLYRVSKRNDETNNSVEKIARAPEGATGSTVAAPHPLDRALDIAHDGLAHIREDIADYSAIMVKRERINNKVCEREFMQIKIRNERVIDGKTVPFSVYMKFLKPQACAGREVIYVHGQNNGKLIVHEPKGSGLGFKTFYLDPSGFLAMKDNRYPIYEAGIENLVVKLIEKANRDRAAGHCEVEYRSNANINKRSCSVIEVVHPDKQAPYDFHKAQVFIDDELNIPVRYAAYDWPTTPGGEPELMEEYTYVKVEINVGLTDKDFDPANEAYAFPGH